VAGATARPASSNSSTSGGYSPEVRFIRAARASSTTLTTNSRVASTLRSVSFLPSAPAPRNDAANAMVGGSSVMAMKYENGARLRTPTASTVDTHAMGRGTTELMRSLYIALGGSVVGSNSTRRSAVHDEAAIDAERLARHVPGAVGGEEPDDGGHVLGALHASQRDLRGAAARERLGRRTHQGRLLPRDASPHDRLHEGG